MNSPVSVDIVSELSRQEYAIAALYSAFAAALPETAAFWKALAVQERAHGEVLGELVKLCNSEDVYLDTTKFKVEAIRTNIGNIGDETAKASSQGISPIRAFAIAADIENSLIEKEYFTIVRSRLPAVRQELEQIERHTRQHIKLVEDGLRREKERAAE